MLLIKIIFFYLLLLLSYFSIAGYGKKITIFFNNNNNKNASECFFYGLIVIIPLSILKVTLFNTNLVASLIILFFGIILFFKYFKIKDLYQDIIILIFLFLGLLISKTHEDFYYYHLQYLREINNEFYVLGLAVADIKYIYGSSIAYLQSIFVINENYNYIHIPIFLFFSSTTIFFLKEIFNKKNNDLETFYSLFISILLLIKFKRISEFGYDYIYHFLFFFIFYSFFLKNNKNLFFLSSFFIILIFIKNTSFLLIPFYILFLLKNFLNLESLRNFNLLKLFIVTSLCSIFIINIFLKSGCILIPSKITCLNKNIPWTVNYKESNAKTAISWAKGYYHQDENVRITSEDEFNKKFRWTKNWFSNHFKNKVSEYLLVLLFCTALILIFNINLKTKKNLQDKRKIIFLFLTSLISLCLWFSIIPQFRFGISQITLTFFFPLYFIAYKYFNFKKLIRLVLLLIFSLSIYNFSNLYRINKEFSRKDLHKFSNFPFVNIRNVQHKKKQSENFYYYYADKSDCINSKPICSTKEINVKKMNKLIVLSNKKMLQ